LSFGYNDLLNIWGISGYQHLGNYPQNLQSRADGTYLIGKDFLGNIQAEDNPGLSSWKLLQDSNFVRGQILASVHVETPMLLNFGILAKELSDEPNGQPEWIRKELQIPSFDDTHNPILGKDGKLIRKPSAFLDLTKRDHLIWFLKNQDDFEHDFKLVPIKHPSSHPTSNAFPSTSCLTTRFIVGFDDEYVLAPYFELHSLLTKAFETEAAAIKTLPENVRKLVDQINELETDSNALKASRNLAETILRTRNKILSKDTTTDAANAKLIQKTIHLLKQAATAVTKHNKIIANPQSSMVHKPNTSFIAN